ncbi:uncharacterized protein LOC125227069 [Leguminivora glycinivorella]|uniref:uncharacterized protein LOC125227069 n=1 Tax=Leguminivora glycinivorella TaxID=1035111 RepID=UPI00200DDCBE|nr:uncharacterized protein LOC125227069 [Leguminivora glycinivorella]
MTQNISMSTEQLQQLVTSLTSAALQAAAGGARNTTASFANVSFSYDGTRESMRLEEFLSAASVYKKVNDMSDEAAIMSLPLVLKGEASTWWQGVKEGISRWTDFESRLRHAFAPKISGVQIFQEVFSRRQPSDMLSETFIAKNRALLTQLRSPGLTEELQIDAIHGQLNINIRERIPRDSVTTFDQLLTAARNVEQVLRERASTTLSTTSGSKQPSQASKKQRCDFCRATGHTVEECRKRMKQMGGQPGQGQHPPKEIKTESTQAPSPSMSTLYCYGCGMPGYTRSKCPKCKEAQPVKIEKTGFCALDINLDARPRMQVGIAIFDVVGTAFVDPGAKSSVASYQLYKCLKQRQCSFASQTANISMADGLKRREDVMSITVPVKICDRTVPTTFVVLPHAKENKTLLGMGFIEDAGMVINIPQRSWNFVERPDTNYDFILEEPDNVSMAQFEPDLYPGVLPKHTQPTDRKEPKVATEAPSYNPVPVKRSRQVFDGYEPESHHLDYMFADAVQSIEESVVTLSPKSEALFTGYTADDIDLCALEVGTVKMGTVTDEQKNQIEEVITKNKEVCLPSKQPTTLIEHAIDAGDHAPIAVPPYRLSPVRREQLKNEIDKMLTEGIIEPASSPWSAPAILVPKKDGTLRPCVDYRRLNAITVPDLYPMPRIDDLLRDAKPTFYMSTLDLRSGYWQVKVRDEDQNKTSFITPFGIFKFIRMPFGLRNAPATFQRLIDRVKALVGDVRMLAYLDDLIILSESFEQHVEDLEKVLKVLKENNLTINLAKCHFCCNSVKYLGHVITSSGLQPDPTKVEAITSLPQPRNLKHLLSFIQTCSWYRRFIPNFSKVSEPLTRLTKKNAQWEWKEAQEKAFNDLKSHLISAPVLKSADETKPYIIKADASNYAIGAVIVQGEGEDEHPIEYASRLLTSAERNYSTTEREALALVWSLNKFRGYIEGGHVTLVTDHQALKWLLTIKTPTGRLARWALIVQAYNVTIKYAPGKTNVVADALSRPQCDTDTSTQMETATMPNC